MYKFNYRYILHISGWAFLFLSASLLAPALVAFIYKESILFNFSVLSFSLFMVSCGLIKFFKSDQEPSSRDSMLGVAFVWLAMTILGGVPYIFSGALPNFFDAFFEASSGFTTTGATVISSLQSLPKGLLFWRAETQWIGGMGIIVLSVALLPHMGMSNYSLFSTEVPGLDSGRLTPKIKSTAQILWSMYLIFTVAEVLALWFCGMTLFDSICHSFATIASGGFSNYDQSIAYYTSPAIQWVIILFMVIAGSNFSIHYRAFFKGKFINYFREEEFITYIAILGLFSYLCYIINDQKSFLNSAFQVASLGTSTGFANDNYDQWYNTSKLLLFILFTVGACTGSTSGGIKILRIIVLFKSVKKHLVRIIHPVRIFSVQSNNRSVSDEVITKVGAFVALYIFIAIIATSILLLSHIDALSALSAVFTCMSNTGPGLNRVGPSHTFGELSDLVKFTLSMCMLIGRLEIYPLLLVFTIGFWKK